MKQNFQIKYETNILNFGSQDKYDIREGDYEYISLQVDIIFFIECNNNVYLDLGVLSYNNGVCEISYDTPENDIWEIYEDGSSAELLFLFEIDQNRTCLTKITSNELEDIFDEIKDNHLELANYIENLENLKIFLKNFRLSIKNSYPDFDKIDTENCEQFN